MYKFDFSSREYEYFLSKCPFTDEEIEILKLKRKGKSNISIAMTVGISERTVGRRIKSIQNKILKELK